MSIKLDQIPWTHELIQHHNISVLEMEPGYVPAASCMPMSIKKKQLL